MYSFFFIIHLPRGRFDEPLWKPRSFRRGIDSKSKRARRTGVTRARAIGRRALTMQSTTRRISRNASLSRANDAFYREIRFEH